MHHEGDLLALGPAGLNIWRSALAGRPNTSFVLIPDLNHFLIPGSGPSTPAEYDVAGHVDASVIAHVANFVSEA